MRKNWLLVLSVAITLGLGGCKAKESAYKAAYEKAQEKEITETPAPETEAVAIAKPSKPTTYTGATNTERVTAVDANDAGLLKTYNVVVGSFTNHTNASALKESLQADGYQAILAQNEKGMYRVIAGSYDNRASATDFRSSLQEKYPDRFKDAWLLINQ